MDHRNSNYKLNRYNNNNNSSQYQVYRQDNQNRQDNQGRQDNQNRGGNRGGNNYNPQGQNSSSGRYYSSNQQGGSSYQSSGNSHGNYGSNAGGNYQGHQSNSDRRGGDSRRSGGSGGYQKDRYSQGNNYHGQSSGQQGGSNMYHGSSSGNYGNSYNQGGGYSSGQNSSRGGNHYENNDRDRRQQNIRGGNYNDRNYERRRNDRNDNRSHHYGGSGGHSGGHHQNSHNRNSSGYHHHQSSNQVQNFYNNHRQYNKQERNNLETRHIRVFHNWVKSVLISKYGELQRSIVKAENTAASLPDNCLYVLDLACGKGGDHKKWLMHNHAALYIGVDISMDSLSQAYSRAVITLDEIKQNSRHHSNIKFGFFEKDCTSSSEDFWKHIIAPISAEGDQNDQTIHENMDLEGDKRNQGSPNTKEGENGSSSVKKEGDEAGSKGDKNSSKYMFDIVSCQMAMHYMHESEQSVRNFLENCTSKMNDQGFLLLTFTDGDAVLDIIKKKGTPTEQGGTIYTSKHFSIKFDTPVDQIDINAKPYGNQYGFYLQEAVGTNTDGQIKHVPEYLVNTNNFIQLAKEYSLEVKENNILTDFFEVNKNQFGQLLKQLSVTFSQEEDQKDPNAWEVSHCYRTLVFQKTLSQPNRVQFDRSTRHKQLLKYPVNQDYKPRKRNEDQK